MKKRFLLAIALVVAIVASSGFVSSAEARSQHRTIRRAPIAKPIVSVVTPPATVVVATATPVPPAPIAPITPAALPAVPVTASVTPIGLNTPYAAPVTAPGRWVGFYVPGAPSDMAPIDTLETQTGSQAAVVNFFVADTEAFPTSRCNNIVANGSTPLITLEFWSTQTGGLSAITNGSKDAYIRSFAASAKSLGKEVWLRPFHEMNGSWYPWGDTGSNTPAQEIAAYRHVHDLFVAAGATNVKFVWCPNVDFAISTYYPGDAYVDYAAIDGYNNAIPWRSFSNIFGPTYTSIAAVSSKPIFIAETSCVEGGTGKAAWITDMFSQITAKYPRIVGVCWFDASLTYDWRVDTSAASVAAFKAGVTKGF
jgi:hypothetical protein